MKTPTFGKRVLSGDIGATKTSLGLYSYSSKRPEPEVIETYLSGSASSLADIITLFLKKHLNPFPWLVLECPAQWSEENAGTTNLPWKISQNALKKHFRWDKVVLLNDLVGTATAVRVLAQDELLELNHGQPNPDGTIGVVAPGTGLGMSFLMCCNGKAYSMASEGGHANSPPRNDREIRLLKFMLNSMPSVSWKKVASGPSLYTICFLVKECN